MNKSPHEQIKFGFAKEDSEFSADNKPKATSEKRMKPKKKLKIVVEEFWNKDVDTQYNIFKRVFLYKPDIKPEEINTRQVALAMLSEYSGSVYEAEDCDTVPRRDFYNLEILVLDSFSRLKEDYKQGDDSIQQKSKWTSHIGRGLPEDD